MEPRPSDSHSPSIHPGPFTPCLKLCLTKKTQQALMSAPNPDDPLANDVADHWKSDEGQAMQQGPALPPCCENADLLVAFAARQWTEMHAKNNR